MHQMATRSAHTFDSSDNEIEKYNEDFEESDGPPSNSDAEPETHLYDSGSDRGSMFPHMGSLIAWKWGLSPSELSRVSTEEDDDKVPLPIFRLLDLSAELRNRIYAYCFHGDGAVEIE